MLHAEMTLCDPNFEMRAHELSIITEIVASPTDQVDAFLSLLWLLW